MGSKIGLLLSMIFIAIFVVFGVDLIVLQNQYSDLESKATTIAYYIAKDKNISNEYILNLEDRYDVSITLDSDASTSFGSVIDFTISKDYQPLFIYNDLFHIKINRSTVIGYYG